MIKRLTLILALTLSFILIPVQSAAASKSKADPNLKVHFIDVGVGDSILLSCGGENMVVDFGNPGNRVYKYLKKKKIKKLKYAVCTHPHIDHIGSMNLILKKCKVFKVLMSKYKRSDLSQYISVMKTIKRKKIPLAYPKPDKVLKLGKAKLKFLGPLGSGYEDINDYSLVIKVIYGKNSFLLTGDAGFLPESEMIDRYGSELQSDVLKVSHHGADTATSPAFLDCVLPKYAIISTEKDYYGKPADITLENLIYKGSGTRNIEILRTDKKGSIVATSNGKKISWKFQK